MRNLISIYLLFSSVYLFSQQGFRKIYAGTTTGATFVDILWDGEKLITTGQFLTDTAPNGALNGLLYMELDTNGNTLHTDLYFEPNDAIVSSIGNSVAQSLDGKIFVLTQALDDTGGLLNIYQNGALESTKKFDFPAFNTTLGSFKETNNIIFLTGNFQNLQYDSKGFLIKTDTHGNKLWEKHYGQQNLNIGLGEPFIKNENTMLLPAGKVYWESSNPIENNWTKSWVLTVDSMGTIKSEWESPKNIENGIGTRIVELSNGNWLYATTEFIPLPGQIDDWGTKPKLVCRDSNFNLVWERCLSNFVSNTNYVIDLTPTPDGNYVVVGRWDWYTTTVIHKFAPNGDPIWSYFDDCEPLANCDNALGGVAVLPSGSIYAAGFTENYALNKSFGVLIKLNKDGCLDTLTCGGDIGIEEKDIISKIKIFPNPTTDRINIENPIGEKVELYDIQGRKRKEEDILKATHSMDISNLETGVYLLKMQAGKLNLTYKIIKQ
jgi:Secretion system C-terminal sorting domain